MAFSDAFFLGALRVKIRFEYTQHMFKLRNKKKVFSLKA